MDVIVTSVYASVNLTDSVSTRILVHKRSASPYGAGIGIAGVMMRLFPFTEVSGGKAALLTDGDGSMYYYAPSPLGSGKFLTPGGATATLTLSGAVYRLTALDSSYVELDTAGGRMTKAVDRFGNQTLLQYVPAGVDTLLRAIVDPMGKIDSLCYGSNCGTTGSYRPCSRLFARDPPQDGRMGSGQV